MPYWRPPHAAATLPSSRTRSAPNANEPNTAWRDKVPRGPLAKLEAGLAAGWKTGRLAEVLAGLLAGLTRSTPLAPVLPS